MGNISSRLGCLFWLSLAGVTSEVGKVMQRHYMVTPVKLPRLAVIRCLFKPVLPAQ